MPTSEKRAFEAHADKSAVFVTGPDGSTIGGAGGLTPGDTYVTADRDEWAALEENAFVKSVPLPGSKQKSDDGGGK